MKKTKKTKIEKMSLLTKRKDINDKFFDLVAHKIKAVPNKNGKFKKVGVKQLANELEISTSVLNSYIKKGSINLKNDELYINIERNFDKLKIPKTKKTTKEFTVHNFTYNNFFARKPFKVKKDEQLYFRAGLYLVFKTGKNGTYTIQNLPVSHYSNNYPKGYEEFFEIIKFTLSNHPSLKYFRFNYFDVQKINLGTIEERVQRFQTKFNSQNKKKKRK